jgi:glycosyltransferase involved in cell wall biosynthesis
MRRQPFDIVYHRFTKSSFVPLIRARVLKKPVVLELNADLRSELRHHWGHFSPKRKTVELIERINYALADHIIGVSRGIAASIQRVFSIPERKISVVPNGTDLYVFQPLDPYESRRRLGLHRDHYYVLFAGTFQAWQGLNTIIGAAQLLHNHRPPITFLMVGDGPEGPAIRSLVRDLDLEASLRFPGWCLPKHAALYMGASDICLAPYATSALADPDQLATKGALMNRSPLKVYSYLAAGRPVIASHFADAGQMVEEIGAGVAIEPDAPQALAEAIADLLADEARRRRQGEMARATAEDRFGWDAVARRIADICAQVIAG